VYLFFLYQFYQDPSQLQILSAPLLRHHAKANEMDIEPSLLAEPDANEADSLISSNDPDDMENEQTWPTEEDMNGSAHEDGKNTIPDAPKGTTPRIVKRIPKGMSSYQASWFVDETDDEGDGEDRNDSDQEMREEEEEMVDFIMDEDKGTDVESRHVDFEELDNGEEGRQCVSGQGTVPVSLF